MSERGDFLASGDSVDARLTTPDVAAAFREAVGRDPEGVFAAPGRVNLIGEHTDHNDGHVLPFAIDRHCRVAAARRADDTVTVRSAQAPDEAVTTTLDALPRARGWSAYALGTLWALREAGLPGDDGWDLVVAGDVPLGSGLSSSAALECAVALAVAELSGADLDRPTLARAGRRAENDVVGAPVGIMDQAASLLCREGAALLLDCRTLEGQDVALGLDEVGLVTLVVDTRVRHDLADGGYADRRAACVAAAEALGVPALRDATPAMLERLDGDLLRRARHVVTEQARVHRVVALLRAGRPAEVGPELTASHASLRDDFAVSVPALDAVVEAALEHGALGARLVGGGFGGSVLVLAPASAAERIGEAVVRRAADDGHPEPVVRAVRPAGGARREPWTPAPRH
ncbi:galactokinase [Actinomycetospora lemnae]|uniref:Galactokinase n=1 Tax=Actinomycetospora lemnae TaxID=3019891 RepID=A0ABT5T237_9PSEU|nr:galactokinase [Actinomycetospora sp. DW7H6]MDD7968297.1 galactokinase [Actinomycetospora sp. DW7H6]